MEAWIEELRPYPGEGRFGAGWRLAKSAWRLLRAEPTLRRLALAQTLLLTLVYCGQLAVADFSLSLDRDGLGLALLAHAVGAFGTVFLMFAFLTAADAALDGIPLGPAEALAEARERPGAVLGWGLITLGASLGTWLLTAALGWAVLLAILPWGLLSSFAIPALAYEGVGPGAALAESARTARWRWRPLLAGLVGIGVLAVLAALVPAYLFEHVAASRNAGSGQEDLLLVVAFALLALVVSLALATREAFGLILLREDLDDLPGGPHRGPRRRRRTKVLRFAGACLLVGAGLVGASALTEGDREINEASGAPGAVFETVVANPRGVELEGGSGVYYRDLEIGTVLGSEREGPYLRIRFHVEPGYGPDETPGAFTIAGSSDGCPCLVLVPGGAGGASPDLQIS